MEIYRDERELVWFQIQPQTVSTLYKKYIRPSLLFREIMPGYFSIPVMVESGIFPLELIEKLEKTYMSLFRKDLLAIRLGKNFPVFSQERAKGPTTLKHLLKGFGHSFLIACCQCKTIVQLSRRSFTVDHLYGRLIRPSEGEGLGKEKPESIGYCSITKEFLCSTCELVFNCRHCNNTIRGSERFSGSGMCTRCFHKPNPQIQRCQRNHKSRPFYTQLRACSLCNTPVCERHFIYLEVEYYTFCLVCLTHGYTEGIVLDDPIAVEKYVGLTWADFRQHPLTMDGKIKYQTGGDYLDAFKKLPNQLILPEQQTKRITTRVLYGQGYPIQL